MKKNILLLKIAALLSAAGAALCLGLSAAFSWVLRRAGHPVAGGASGIGIIGGADGPTAVFVTGGPGFFDALPWAGALLAAAAVALWCWVRHLRNGQG